MTSTTECDEQKKSIDIWYLYMNHTDRHSHTHTSRFNMQETSTQMWNRTPETWPKVGRNIDLIAFMLRQILRFVFPPLSSMHCCRLMTVAGSDRRLDTHRSNYTKEIFLEKFDAIKHKHILRSMLSMMWNENVPGFSGYSTFMKMDETFPNVYVCLWCTWFLHWHVPDSKGIFRDPCIMEQVFEYL